MKSSHAIAALVATTLALGGALPAFAEGATTPTAMHWWNSGPRHMQPMGPGHNMGPGRGMAGPMGLLRLACSDRGAEALEISLVRLSHRLNLTSEQQPLFDAFRTRALTTETSFADACKASRPDHGNNRPDMLARLKSTLAIDQARLTALNDVLPDFEALYNSLSDQQKQALLPRRGFGIGMGPGRWHGHGQGAGPANDAAPQQPVTPSVPQNS
jgi:hypothetical protein